VGLVDVDAHRFSKAALARWVAQLERACSFPAHSSSSVSRLAFRRALVLQEILKRAAAHRSAKDVVVSKRLLTKTEGSAQAHAPQTQAQAHSQALVRLSVLTLFPMLDALKLIPVRCSSSLFESVAHAL